MENIALKNSEENEMSAPVFRTIGEVASEIGIPPHVLRFWESKFDIIKPHKRKGGHRYYKPTDIQAIKDIKRLLYDEGFTIKGAQKFLKDKNESEEEDYQTNLFDADFSSASNSSEGANDNSNEFIKNILKQLFVIKENIDNAR